jgi:DNA polymerase-1
MPLSRNYGLVKSLDQLKLLADKLLEQGQTIGFDIETGYSGPDRKKGSLDMMWAEQFIVGFSITNNPSWARYVPIMHDNAEGNLPEHDVWEIIKPVLETLPTVAHHLKFEQKNLLTLEWKGRGPNIEIRHGRDSMLSAYVLSEWKGFGLKQLIYEIFGHKMTEIEELFPEGATQKELECLRFNTLQLLPEVTAYACEDSAWALALDEKITPRAQEERGQIWAIEHQTSELMKEVEQYGQAVAWEEMEEEYKQAIPFRAKMETAVKQSLSNLALRDVSDINLASSQQLKQLLYRDLGYTTTRLTPAGKKDENADWEPWKKMSSDAIALEALSKDIPAIKKLLEMREVDVLLRRFKKWLTEYHFDVDDRVHPTFSQVVVGSGRFSAADPAVQQLPKKWGWSTHENVTLHTPEWDEILKTGTAYEDYWAGNFRDYIWAAEGTYFIGYDYSQIELRVLAGVSQEPALLHAFENDEDVHSLTGARMLGVKLEGLTPEQRAVGKTMNFALMYQMGVQSLAERLAISLERAQELYDAYFAQFSAVDTWMQRALEVGKANGFAETPFGRKYTVWELQDPRKAIRAKGERVLINAPIQGGAADYMKMAMIRAWKALKKEGLWGAGKAMLVHNLHDALVFEVDNSIHPWEIRDLLQPAVVFPIPGFPKIKADWELGWRHGSCKSWKDEDVELKDGRWQVVKGSQRGVQSVPEQVPIRLTVVPDLPKEPEDSGWHDSMNAELPETMFRTTTFDDSTDEELTPVKMVPIDEAAEDSFNDPIEVEVVLGEMPSADQATALMTLVKSRPGGNTLVLMTPQGEARVPIGTSLDIKDKALLSLTLGGASVRRARGSVDIDALARGIEL